jgi:hypothetical protein
MRVWLPVALVLVSAPALAQIPTLTIDPQGAPGGQPFQVCGFTYDQTNLAFGQLGIQSMTVQATKVQEPDPAAASSHIALTPTLGLARPDVASFKGLPFTNSGWCVTVPANTLTDGHWLIQAYARPVSTIQPLVSQSVYLTLGNELALTVSSPTPTQSIPANTPFAITGFAQSNTETNHTPTGVSAIDAFIYRVGSAELAIPAMATIPPVTASFTLTCPGLTSGSYLLVVQADATTQSAGRPMRNIRVIPITVP